MLRVFGNAYDGGTATGNWLLYMMYFYPRTGQSMFWVPASGNIGVGVSILSYDGGVQFGLITDARMCPDPEDIVERFAPEFDKLMWLALMGPWPAVEA